MWQNSKLFQPPPQFIHPTSTPPPPPPQLLPHPKQQCKLSRRELTLSGKSVVLLSLASQALDHLHPFKAKAEENSVFIDETEQVQIPSSASVDGTEEVPNPSSSVIDETLEVPNPSSASTGETGQVQNLNASVDDTEQVQNPSSASTGETEPVQNPTSASIGETELVQNPTSASIGETEQVQNPTSASGCYESKNFAKKAFLDISIDGQPQGKIILGLYDNDVPNAAAKFSSFVSGAAGVSYRRKEFIKIMPNYVQHGGVRSYGVDADMAKKTGSTLATEKLVSEWEKMNERCPGTKNTAGKIGIVVRNPLKPPPKMKLVARKGKLEIDEEEVGSDPNGTEFVISYKDSPDLDSSVLVVGEVLEGMDVVEKIGQVKTVQDNTSSPYFRVAKLIGDKRAVVAERGFNRPYSKVVVTNCGLMK